MLLLLASLSLAQDAPAEEPATDEAAAEEELPPIVKMPEILEYVEAPYPPEAKELGLEGEVLLLIEIDETGKVSYVEVLQGLGHGFDEAAVEAVQQMLFSPAEDPNGPTAVALEFAYGFVLDTGSHEDAVPQEEAEPEPVEAPVNLTGQVIEMATRRQLGEMFVSVAGTELTTQTDAEGRFELRGVPLGTVTVEVARPGWATKQIEIEILEGQVQDAQIWVKNEDYAENEAVGVYTRNKDEVTRTTISMAEARKIPGTFGDPIRVIQNLPGAARSPFSTGLLIIRGANPEDSGVYVDGVRIPIIYHLGGFASVIAPELVESVDYLPGSYGVQYGRQMGGTIDVTTKKDAPEQAHLAWSTDLLDSGGVFEARLGKDDQHHVGVAARRSYVDAIIVPVQQRVGTNFVASPRWMDYQLRYGYRGLDNTNIDLFVMGLDDKLILSTPDDFAQGTDQDAQGGLSVHYFTHRAILNVEHRVNDKVDFIFKPAVGWDKTEFGLGQAFRSDIDQLLLEVRAETPITLNEHVQIVPGVDYISGWYRFQFELPVNPDTFDTFDPLAEREDWGVSDTGSFWGPDVYLKANLRPLQDTDRLYLQPGMRVSYVNVPGQYDTVGYDPRIAGKLRLWKDGYLKAASGLYTQPPQATESYQPEGNYELFMEKSWASSVGFDQQLPLGFSFTTEAFYKDLWDLIVFNPDWTGLEDNAYVNEGTGHIYGAELMLRKDSVGNAFGWVSYTYSRSFRQDYEDSKEYPYDFDQPHIFTALGGYKLPWQIQVSGRFQYTSGLPYTGYDGAIYDADLEVWNPFSTGDRNSSRLPPYYALDARVEKGFTGKRFRGSIYVDFLNVIRGDNPEFVLYNYDYTESVYVGSLPFIPSPGFEIEGYL